MRKWGESERAKANEIECETEKSNSKQQQHAIIIHIQIYRYTYICSVEYMARVKLLQPSRLTYSHLDLSWLANESTLAMSMPVKYCLRQWNII